MAAIRVLLILLVLFALYPLLTTAWLKKKNKSGKGSKEITHRDYKKWRRRLIIGKASAKEREKKFPGTPAPWPWFNIVVYTGACRGNRCQNGGVCEELVDPSGPQKTLCACLDTHRGSKCSTPMVDCIDAQCTMIKSCIPKRGGAFTRVGFGRGGGICICAKGNIYSTCSMDVRTHADMDYNVDMDFEEYKRFKQWKDPCKINPCFNGGTCSLMKKRLMFWCICPVEYQGKLCEKDTQKSESHVCHLTRKGPLCIDEDVWSYPIINTKKVFEWNPKASRLSQANVAAPKTPRPLRAAQGAATTSSNIPGSLVAAAAGGGSITSSNTRGSLVAAAVTQAGGTTSRYFGGIEKDGVIVSNDGKSAKYETPATCKTHQCVNSTCSRDPTKKTDGYLCVCPIGKTGLRCDEVRHDCASYICTRIEDCMYTADGSVCVCNSPSNSEVCLMDLNLSTVEQVKELDKEFRFIPIVLGVILDVFVSFGIYMCCKWPGVRDQTSKLRKRYKKKLDRGKVPSEPPADTWDVYRAKLVCSAGSSNAKADDGSKKKTVNGHDTSAKTSTPNKGYSANANTPSNQLVNNNTSNTRRSIRDCLPRNGTFDFVQDGIGSDTDKEVSGKHSVKVYKRKRSLLHPKKRQNVTSSPGAFNSRRSATPPSRRDNIGSTLSRLGKSGSETTYREVFIPLIEDEELQQEAYENYGSNNALSQNDYGSYVHVQKNTLPTKMRPRHFTKSTQTSRRNDSQAEAHAHSCLYCVCSYCNGLDVHSNDVKSRKRLDGKTAIHLKDMTEELKLVHNEHISESCLFRQSGTASNDVSKSKPEQTISCKHHCQVTCEKHDRINPSEETEVISTGIESCGNKSTLFQTNPHNTGRNGINLTVTNINNKAGVMDEESKNDRHKHVEPDPQTLVGASEIITRNNVKSDEENYNHSDIRSRPFKSDHHKMVDTLQKITEENDKHLGLRSRDTKAGQHTVFGTSHQVTGNNVISDAKNDNELDFTNVEDANNTANSSEQDSKEYQKREEAKSATRHRYKQHHLTTDPGKDSSNSRFVFRKGNFSYGTIARGENDMFVRWQRRAESIHDRSPLKTGPPI